MAIDGKTLRGSQGHQLPGVRLLAAFRPRLGVATAQAPAGQGPGGEWDAAAQLLARLDLAGRVITRLHHVRDVTLGEDACRVRTGAAPQALAAVRNPVISLVRLAGNTNVAAAPRRFAARRSEALAAIGIVYPTN